ncbi:entericidin A/B family lipoprotein [Phenylobacterium sp.]
MRTVQIMALAAAAMVLAACNTVAGVGRDLEAAGSAVRTTAQDVAR